MTDARVFNESAEVLEQAPADARTFNESVEVLARGTPDARLFNESVEVLVKTVIALSATGLSSAEAMGAASIRTQLVATGLSSGETIGAATIAFQQRLVATGLASAETLGSAMIETSHVLVVTGLPSLEAFGGATISEGALLVGTGIPSEEALGSALMTNGFALPSVSFSLSPDLEADLTDVVVTDTAISSSMTDAFVASWGGVAPVSGQPPGSNVTVPPAHIGVDIPRTIVKIRSGRFRRNYRSWNNDLMPVGATIANSNFRRPWSPLWIPNTRYEELPNVLQVDLTKSYDANGIGSATIQIDNIVYPENAGGGHDVRRGFLSPLRGYLSDDLVDRGAARPTDLDGTPITMNAWFNKLDSEAQITIWQTYGTNPPVKVFTGLIEDVDIVSRPDQITIQARDFGQVLPTERLFGWNKDPVMKSSIVFIDREEAHKLTRKGGDASASSEAGTRTADLAVDTDSETSWRSDHHTSPNVTEWLQFHVPAGKYTQVFLNPNFEDVNAARYTTNTLDIYVSIFARGDSTMNGDPVDAGAWIDPGIGNVPDTGTPYVKLYSNSSLAAVRRDLDATFTLGDDSVIRFSFRGLAPIGDVHYAAGVTTAYAIHAELLDDAAKQHWVLVDDISDVVKVCLRWAGFKEWAVESTGTKLPKRVVYQRGSTYMDIIQQMADIVGYTFFIGDPTPAGRSIGVPVFRKTFTLADNIAPKAVITDRNLLTAIAVKQSDEALSYHIRARGRSAKHGQFLGGDTGDTGKRLMYLFEPPWVGHFDSGYEGRLGGVLKYVIYTNHLFKTIDQCRFACYQIALSEALASVTASIEFPGYPGIDLDDHILLSDLGTGITTRLAIAQRSSSFVYGEHTKWTTTVGGSLIDTKDVQDMVRIINNAVRD